jgi:hypothetical protein
MFILGLFSAIYFIIAVLSICITYSERCYFEKGNPITATLGFLACVLWPVTFPVVAVAAYLKTPKPAAE